MLMLKKTGMTDRYFIIELFVPSVLRISCTAIQQHCLWDWGVLLQNGILA